MAGTQGVRLGRRAVLKQGSLILGGLGTGWLAGSAGWAAGAEEGLQFGLITDLHYADKPAAGSRHYRDTPVKLAEAAERFQGRQLAFVTELGDFIDAADSVAAELGFLERIESQFAAIHPVRHYVLGNHCVHTLTKEEFLEGVQQPRSYYSFDAGGMHFVVLDCCFRSDGTPYGRKNFQWTDPNVPAAELAWLKADLAAHPQPTIVFTHQRLDIDNHYAAKNAAAVRQVLRQAGNVRCVFQGHSHKNDYRERDGIHFCTLVAMVEGPGVKNNGFSVVRCGADGTITLEGFVKQADYRWAQG